MSPLLPRPSLTAIVLGLAMTTAAGADPVADCNSQDGRLAVSGCSRLIASGELADDKLSIALNNRGIAYVQRQLGVLAIADFVVAKRIDPSNVMAMNNLCHVWLDADQPSRALAACTEAIEVKSDFYEAYSNRALAHLALGNLSAALDDANQSLLINPDCPDALANRGFLHEKSGRIPEAIGDYEKALSLAPGHALARERLEQLRRGAQGPPPRHAVPALARLGQIGRAPGADGHPSGCAPAAELR